MAIDIKSSNTQAPVKKADTNRSRKRSSSAKSTAAPKQSSQPESEIVQVLQARKRKLFSGAQSALEPVPTSSAKSTRTLPTKSNQGQEAERVPAKRSYNKRTSHPDEKKQTRQEQGQNKQVPQLPEPQQEESSKSIQHQQDQNNSVKIVKLKAKDARAPSGLETPLSTSSWDLYEDKMPEDIAQAVRERVEMWLFEEDSEGEYAERTARYGESIASSFAGGGTPGFARMLAEVEEAYADESSVVGS